MSIFDFLEPSYLKNQLDKLTNLNISLTDLRDAIIGTGNKSLTDIYNKLDSIGGSISITNFPSWFTNSTKKTDDLYDDLEALKGALESVNSDRMLIKLQDPLPAGDNWIGKIKLGDGTNVASVIAGTIGGISSYLLGVAPDLTKVFSGGDAYTEQEVSVTTTEQSSSFSPSLRAVVLTNKGDVDITIKLNGGTTTKTIPARSSKVIVFFEISSISYVVASGSSILKIEGYW